MNTNHMLKEHCRQMTFLVIGGLQRGDTLLWMRKPLYCLRGNTNIQLSVWLHLTATHFWFTICLHQFSSYFGACTQTHLDLSDLPSSKVFCGNCFPWRQYSVLEQPLFILLGAEFSWINRWSFFFPCKDLVQLKLLIKKIISFFLYRKNVQCMM